jgi:hypothetical protein
VDLKDIADEDVDDELAAVELFASERNCTVRLEGELPEALALLRPVAGPRPPDTRRMRCKAAVALCLKTLADGGGAEEDELLVLEPVE